MVVFLAGFVPWALLWQPIGAVQAFLVGAVVAAAVAFAMTLAARRTNLRSQADQVR